MNTAYLGLGSNLGNRLDNLCQAVRALSSMTALTVEAVSAVYETEPVGGPPQKPYLNAAVEIRTDLMADSLLAECLAIEQRMGRERTERWGPRIIDIDVLLYGDITIDKVGLIIPHPRIAERGFVLYPLADIAGDVMHPVHAVTIDALRDRVGSNGIERRDELRLETCIGQAPEDDQ